jgi:hypothetical protein
MMVRQVRLSVLATASAGALASAVAEGLVLEQAASRANAAPAAQNVRERFIAVS